VLYRAVTGKAPLREFFQFRRLQMERKSLPK